MDVRTRLLLILMAFSLFFLYDVGANGKILLKHFASGFVRISPAIPEGSLYEDMPFISKKGQQSIEGQGLATLHISTIGDIEVSRSSSDEILLEYEVRTYGLSRRHVEEFHNEVEFAFHHRDDVLDIRLEQSAQPQERAEVRGRLHLQVPAGLNLRINNQHGDINLFGVEADLQVAVTDGSLRVGDHTGNLDLEVKRGSIWLSRVEGDALVRHESGRVEVVGLDGNLDFGGLRSTIAVDGASSGVRADIRQGISGFFSVAGPLEVYADRARVDVSHAQGTVEVQGTFSPIEVVGSHDGVFVSSDRAHVNLRLASSLPWSFDLEARHGKVESDFPATNASTDEAQLLPVVVHTTGGDIKVEAL